MTVKKESGRRSIQVEVEVPGTPEQVWEAIATGPGVSSWFALTEGEERIGGTVKCHMAPGMDSEGTLTAWDPPHRFAAEGRSLGPDAPKAAVEWIVEARSGSTCTVRVVHSLFVDTDDWDDELETLESGWPGFFGVLRLYLTHFRGQSCSIMRVIGPVAGTETQVWDALTSALGIAGAAEGEPWNTPSSDVPPLAGTVERIGVGAKALLRLDHPAPGVVLAGAFTMNDQVHMAISFYLYGEDASAIAARDEPLWQTWMAEQFSPVAR